jgi:hypothetical protein
MTSTSVVGVQVFEAQPFKRLGGLKATDTDVGDDDAVEDGHASQLASRCAGHRIGHSHLGCFLCEPSGDFLLSSSVEIGGGSLRSSADAVHCGEPIQSRAAVVDHSALLGALAYRVDETVLLHSPEHIVRLADRDTGVLREPIDGPLIAGAFEQDLDGSDAGRTKTGLFFTDDLVRDASATATVNVDERSWPGQMQRPPPVAPRQVGDLECVPLLVGDGAGGNEAYRAFGDRLRQMAGG